MSKIYDKHQTNFTTIAASACYFSGSHMPERSSPSRVWQAPTHIPVPDPQANRVVGTLFIMLPIASIAYCVFWLAEWL